MSHHQQPLTIPSAAPAQTSAAQPTAALRLLAKAHVLLSSQADIVTESEFGSVAACAIMLYGARKWRRAVRSARLEILDGEERVGGDLDLCDVDGRDVGDGDWEAEVEVGVGVGVKEIEALVSEAIGEIREWDGEMGRRVEVVLGEAVRSKVAS